MDKVLSIFVTDEIDGVELTQDSKENDLMQRVDSAPVVRMVNALIDAAYRVDASDIHIEPEQDSTRIRFRVDGILSEHMVLKKELHELVTTRIKIISGMNIAEKRKPQDGAIRHTSEKIEVDLRVSSIPTSLGEKLVMRLLEVDTNISYHLDSIDLREILKRNYAPSPKYLIVFYCLQDPVVLVKQQHSIHYSMKFQHQKSQL